MLLAGLEFRILEEVHESALVLEDVLAVQSLAGQDVVSVMLCSRVESELHSAVLNIQLAAESAEFALSNCCTRMDIEIVAVAVRACTLLALPKIYLL